MVLKLVFKKMKKGFTLIELLVVIVVIGILATIATVSFQGNFTQARVAKSLAEMSEIRRAVQTYYLDTGVLPPECAASCDAATDPLLVNVDSVPNWRGPYMEGGLYNRRSPWRGGYGLKVYDSDGDSLMEVWGFFDEDAPELDSNNSEGVIPQKALDKLDLEIDKALGEDSGNFQYSAASGYAEGEAGWFIIED